MAVALFPNSNALAIYSLILRNPNYIGPVIRATRISDSITLDFYADAQGNLTNTTLAGIQTTISQWISGTSASIVIWYDQSGNGNNATQTNLTYQPTFSLTKGIQFAGNGIGFILTNPIVNCYTIAVQLNTSTAVSKTQMIVSTVSYLNGWRWFDNNIIGTSLISPTSSFYYQDFLAPYNSYYYINNLKGNVGGTLSSFGQGSTTVGNNGSYSDNTWNYIVATRDRDTMASFRYIGYPGDSSYVSFTGSMFELILFGNKISDNDAATLYATKNLPSNYI
jgi:hypothetical protein